VDRSRDASRQATPLNARHREPAQTRRASPPVRIQLSQNRSRGFNGAASTLASVPHCRIATMTKLTSLPERALELASQAGDNFKHLVPHAGKWLEAGAKLGVLKSGARVAGMFVRRNPAVTIAAAAGAGLLWYAARRRAKQAENGAPIEGSAKRVEARRGDASTSGSRRSTTAARKRTRATSGNGSQKSAD
jgi:hypothetical protein